jgi:hypothetical protein
MDTSPIGILRIALDYLSPYLPAPIRALLYLTLRGVGSLPPSLANVLPLLVAAFALYTSVMSIYSTARSTFRLAWFFAKWGGIALVVLWGLGMGPLAAMTSGSTSENRAENLGRASYGASGGRSGMADYVQQAASMAGLGGVDAGNAGGAGGIFDALGGAMGGGNAQGQRGAMDSFPYSLLPDPLKQLGTLVTFFTSPGDPNADSSSSGTSRETRAEARKRKQREKEQAEKLQNLGNTASGLFGKAWEAFNAQQGGGDRFAEGRERRKRQGNR